MRVFLRNNRLPRLESANLVLRELGLLDISEEYLAWLNNPDTTRYLEIRLQPQNRERVTRYVLDHLEHTDTSMFFGVYHASADMETLIGTIGINNIQRYHKAAEVSFVIGHPQAQGKGFGTEAVHVACAYLLLVENFQRLGAGHYEENLASRKILEKNGFYREGILRQSRCTVDGRRTNLFIYGLLPGDFIPNSFWLGDNGEILIHAIS